MRLTSGGDISLRNDNVSSRVACLCFVADSQITPQTSAGGEVWGTRSVVMGRSGIAGRSVLHRWSVTCASSTSPSRKGNKTPHCAQMGSLARHVLVELDLGHGQLICTFDKCHLTVDKLA